MFKSMWILVIGLVFVGATRISTNSTKFLMVCHGQANILWGNELRANAHTCVRDEMLRFVEMRAGPKGLGGPAGVDGGQEPVAAVIIAEVVIFPLFSLTGQTALVIGRPLTAQSLSARIAGWGCRLPARGRAIAF
jgi:hypothetical protein